MVPVVSILLIKKLMLLANNLFFNTLPDSLNGDRGLPHRYCDALFLQFFRQFCVSFPPADSLLGPAKN